MLPLLAYLINLLFREQFRFSALVSDNKESRSSYIARILRNKCCFAYVEYGQGRALDVCVSPSRQT